MGTYLQKLVSEMGELIESPWPSTYVRAFVPLSYKAIGTVPKSLLL